MGTVDWAILVLLGIGAAFLGVLVGAALEFLVDLGGSLVSDWWWRHRAPRRYRGR